MATVRASNGKSRAGVPLAGLPVELTAFIGRAAEIAELERLLATSRLLTLTGPGGSGKTRLAVEVAGPLAAADPGGVAWVELAALTDGDLVAQQTAAALGIREEPGRAATEALIAALHDRPMLLLLDNCEHLVDACAALVDALLRGCRGLRVLATSREALGVAGERAWLVPPLSLPETGLDPDPGRLLGFEAVQLFVARAQDALPSFILTSADGEAVARVCRQLDGIPLAIELAAARVRVLTPQQIVQRLDQVFTLLTSTARTTLPRHRTVRAAIDWSYRLLPAPEQVLLQRLAVFAGGFTLEAAEAVCTAEGDAPHETLDRIARLVDRSLVMMREEDGEARYHLLETVRQHAHEQLEAGGGSGAMRQRHATHFLALAESAEPHLFAGAANPAWVTRLDHEINNLRAAADWWLGEGDDADSALRLLSAIPWYWFARGLLNEARTRLEAAAAAGPAATPLVRAKARSALAWAALWQGDQDRVPALLDNAIALLRELNESRALAYALVPLGWARLGEDAAAAKAVLDEAVALSRTHEPSILTALALYWAGLAAQAVGDGDAARGALDEAIAIGRRLDHKPGIGHPLNGRAHVAIIQADYDTALACLTEALRLHGQAGDRWGVIVALDGLARVAGESGAHERAARLLAAATGMRDRIGVSLSAAERAEHDRLLQGLDERLGVDRLAALTAEAWAWPLDDVVAYALDAGIGPAPVTGARDGPSWAGPGAAAGAVLASAGAADRPRDGEAEPELRVLALGPLEVYLTGARLPPGAWPCAKPKELLVFLMLHPNGRTRDQIGEALWPGAARARVKNSFHVTLYHLRKALGGPDRVVLDGDRYRLSPAWSRELDAERFDREARAALANRGAGPDALRRVLATYRGELLEGEVTGRWVEEHRDRLRRLASDLALALGASLETAGDFRGPATGPGLGAPGGLVGG